MKLPPSGYVPTWNDTPIKFRNRMKKRVAEVEEKRNKVGQPAPVIPVEDHTPPLMGQPQFIEYGPGED